MKIRTNGVGEETKKTKGVFEFSLVWFGFIEQEKFRRRR